MGWTGYDQRWFTEGRDSMLTETAKPRVLIGLPSDIFLRNFVETKAFTSLSERFEVFWFTTEAVRHALPELPGFTRVESCKIDPRRDMIRYHLRWLAVFAGRSRSRLMRLKALSVGSRRERWPYTLLSAPGVWPITDALVEAWLGQNQSLAAIFDAVKPDVAVFPSQGNDSFAIDIMKVAKSRRVHTVMLNYNWDNMGSKGAMRIKPDRLCVWGEDMAALARQVHHLRPEQIRIIGAAQFQQYFDPEQMAAASRAAAQSPQEPPRLLFAGASRGHPEARFLKTLDEAIETHRLPALQIIYRPHPWRAPRPHENPFHAYGYRHITMDRQVAGQFMVDDMNAPTKRVDYTFAPSIAYNAELLHSIRGVITPLSTLSLEAALVGVPVLAIHFPEERWLKDALDNFEHLQRMCRQVPGVVICREEPRFLEAVRQLLELGGDPTLPARMREAIKPILYADGATTYADRLASVIEEVLGKRENLSKMQEPVESCIPVEGWVR